MNETFANFITLNVCLFLASFAAGSLPVWLNIDGKRLVKLHTAGMGLMLGTALTVIIPEGIEALNEAVDDHHSFSCIFGSAILSGFLLMLLVESNHDHKSDNLGASKRKHSNLLTTGLLIHAATDGIALGASQFANEGANISNLVVFGAILAHKLPAALSLGSILVSSGLNRKQVTKDILKFSICAPVCGVLTDLVLSFVFFSESVSGFSRIAAAVGLIFSAGTLIHVSVSHLVTDHDFNEIKKLNLLILIVSSFVPLFLLQMFPSHEI